MFRENIKCNGQFLNVATNIELSNSLVNTNYSRSWICDREMIERRALECAENVRRSVVDIRKREKIYSVLLAAVRTAKHQYELEMNGPIVCEVGRIVEMENDAMKNDAKYERGVPSLCEII